MSQRVLAIVTFVMAFGPASSGAQTPLPRLDDRISREATQDWIREHSERGSGTVMPMSLGPATDEEGQARSRDPRSTDAGEPGKTGSVAPGRLVLLGVFLEKNYSTQPGLQVSYGSPELLGGRARFSASYSTTRIATALGSNALTEDRFQVGTGWYFHPTRTISPYAAIHVGHTRFDREDARIFELLDDSAALLSLLFGLEARLLSSFRVNGSIGYSHLQSSTVYPFVASIGFHHDLNRSNRR